MKFSLSLAVLAAAGSAIAQDLSGLPTCAQTAFLGSITGSGCSVSDIACTCKSTAFLNTATAAVQKACSEADQMKTYQFAASLCKQFGVTIPNPYASSSAAAAPSTSAAGTTAAPATTSAPASTSAGPTTVVVVSQKPTNATGISAAPTYTGAAGTAAVNWAAGAVMAGAALLAL